MEAVTGSKNSGKGNEGESKLGLEILPLITGFHQVLATSAASHLTIYTL